MNERIQELAEQAGMKSPDGFSLTVSHMTTFQLEKFAELIVRECAELVKDFYQEDEFTCYSAKTEIKEHFGVEE